MTTEEKIAALFSAFDLPDRMTGWQANMVGHINETYEISAQGGAHDRYILQHINTTVFPDPDALMENFVRVTKYMEDVLEAQGEDVRRGTLRPLPTRQGTAYFRTEQGECWRLFPYIERTITVTHPEAPEQMEQAGGAFGRFQQLLAGFPAQDLHEVIPRFHDTPHRLEAFERAIAQDPLGRAAEVREDIAYVRAHAGDAGRVMGALRRGELPLRVTHNDTKINNVLLDEETGRAVCVIDLDTVMPGSLLFDFGDAIRAGANTAEEDEPDLSKVHLNLPLYEAFARGFLSQLSPVITPLERSLLPFSAWLITYECGTRFLTDHLLGDQYFRIHRPGHNLDRARCQFALAREMRAREAEMQRILSQ